MSLTPFTLDEAEEIREDFEDLIDTDFRIGSSPEMFVENVLVAPLAEADKEHFIDHYYSMRDAAQALAQYAGSDYDVILLTREVGNEANISHINIRDFAVARGIKYDFPQP